MTSTEALMQAVGRGSLEEIEALLDAGADIHYRKPHGYDVLINAVCGASQAQLIPLLRLLIERGANLNGVSDYSQSALSVTSRDGRWDAVELLLDAGADATPLGWTPLMRAVALGTLAEVRASLDDKADLSARDFWSRTPWLLSLQTADIAKAQLILAAGANLADRGRCGKPALFYPIVNQDAGMLRWLLSLGLRPDDTDEFGSSALMEAAERGATECVKILLDAGANIHLVSCGQAAIKSAMNLQIVRLLIDRGADLNDISDEMRAALTKLPFDGKIDVSRQEYLAGKTRVFGRSNPELMNVRFWKSMIASGAIANAARRQFDDTEDEDEPVWCFHRFGKSINELPDGRIIEIAGEHEDYYDADFCIYNDVIVHHGDGRFDIYGYPKEIFPPTDFHTATPVGDYLYIIGNIGYSGERKLGETQVHRLNINSLAMERIETSGENPGWISHHTATMGTDQTIQIAGGKVCAMKDGSEDYTNSSGKYVLDLKSRLWSRLA